MVSLVIYVASFVMVIAIVGSVTLFFNQNIRDLRGTENATSEYNKFNLYMLEYTKNGHEIVKCSEPNAEEVYVTFSKEEKMNTFIKLKDTNILYFNQMKLCENVNDFKIEQATADNGKLVLKTYIDIAGTVYTTDYVMNQYSNPDAIPVEIPEGLEIGSTVNYSPSGTYSWESTYASSDQTSVTSLSSAKGQSFNITNWKVLSMDEKTGLIQLVPANVATGTVRLQGAQGYNNGVKLLNDACSYLYGDEKNGIRARNINIEDIEKLMDKEKLTVAKERYTNKNSAYSHLTIENQLKEPYTTYKKYPIIYGKEELSVITANGETSEVKIEKGRGLSLIDSPKENGKTKFIEPIADSGNIAGTITDSVSIKPYQSYYRMANDEFSSALGNYTSILKPNDSNTTYWVASRCINVGAEYCNFNMRFVNRGELTAYGMDNSNENVGNVSRTLFPIISLKVEKISGDLTNGFKIEQSG